MSKIDYPLGFSPEEIAQRANQNPKGIIKTIDECSCRFISSDEAFNKSRTHLQELCDNWSSDKYSDYLNTIREICRIYHEIAHLSLEVEKHLRDLHSY